MVTHTSLVPAVRQIASATSLGTRAPIARTITRLKNLSICLIKRLECLRGRSPLPKATSRTTEVAFHGTFPVSRRLTPCSGRKQRLQIVQRRHSRGGNVMGCLCVGPGVLVGETATCAAIASTWPSGPIPGVINGQSGSACRLCFSGTLPTQGGRPAARVVQICNGPSEHATHVRSDLAAAHQVVSTTLTAELLRRF